MIELPQSFTLRTECEKVTYQNGFRRQMGEDQGWLKFASTTAKGHVWLAGAGPGGPWFLAIDHDGVAAELSRQPAGLNGPGVARYAFDQLADLYDLLARVYSLGVSLPDGPLESFASITEKMPQTTEAERLVVQRIGQDLFRKSLLEYWGGCCPLTGISDTELLRASHIIPWADCESDADRLDVHNGLLLSALWDAAFDRFLVSFTDEGTPLFSPRLGELARTELRWTEPLKLTARHRLRLAWHREQMAGRGTS